MSPAQLTLDGVEDAGPVAGRPVAPDGWVMVVRGPYGACGGQWVHPCLPGVRIIHCGHPTALRPFYVEGVPALASWATSTLRAAKCAIVAGRRGMLDARGQWESFPLREDEA